MDPQYFGSNLNSRFADCERRVANEMDETAYFVRHSPSKRLLPEVSGVAGILFASLALGIFAMWAE